MAVRQLDPPLADYNPLGGHPRKAYSEPNVAVLEYTMTLDETVNDDDP